MYMAPLCLAFALAAPPAPAVKPPDDGALLYHWLVQSSQTLRQTEFGQMFSAVMSGSMMGPGSGWFKPGHNRYGWAWLAERFDADKDGKVSRKEFPGPKELFDRLDRDRDGTITASDLDWSDSSPYLRQLSQATQWIVRMDEDDDRRLSREEWDALFKRFSQGKGYLNAEDMAAMLFGPPPRPPVSASRGPAVPDMPTRKTLIKGLLDGELGSPLEGPRLGELAPDFVLFDLDGKMVTLSEFRGKKPVVLIFGSFT